MRTVTSSLLRAFGLVCVVCCLFTVGFAAEAKKSFDIPAGDAGPALKKFAAQSGKEIMFPSQPVGGIKTNAVKGEMTPAEALDTMLAKTELVAVQEEKSGAYTIKREANVEKAEKNDSRAAQVTKSDRPSKTEEKILQLDKVTVTGTNIRGIGFESLTQPITTFDKKYIDSTGYSTTSQLIESLPQNFSLSSQSGINVPGTTFDSTVQPQGASINLRGIGEGTTLVLLNGRRLPSSFLGVSVDISALPLSAMDHIDILTDGASALYGSDAIGGVVNFVLAKDYNGAETRARYGFAAGGVDEYRAGQTFGKAWGSGSAMIAAEYYKRDLLRAVDRDFVQNSQVGSLFPNDENQSVIFSGRQNAGDKVSLFTDAMYTHRDSSNEAGALGGTGFYATDNSRFSAAGGFDWQLGAEWQLEGSGSYAKDEMYTYRKVLSVGPNDDFYFDTNFRIESARLKADGPFFALPAGRARAAIGIDWRAESFSETGGFLSEGPPVVRLDKNQIVRSAFSEVYVPIVGVANAVFGIHELGLSLAGRYDSYSNFGSSFDPQIGLMWKPSKTLRLRGNYNTSYKAPNLTDYSLASQSVGASYVGADRRLGLGGNNVNGYRPQKSESYSIGFEVTPSGMPGLELSANYYDIRYRDKIALPRTVLGNVNIIRNPTVAQVNQYIEIGTLGGLIPFIPRLPGGAGIDTNFDPSTITEIRDSRRTNLGVVQTSGFDLSAKYAFVAAGDKCSVGLDGTYILERFEQVRADLPKLETVNTIYNPPHFRARASFSWQHRALATNMFISHTGSYTDNRVGLVPPGSVSAYTVVDLNLAYDFSARSKSGLLSGMRISLSIQNVFDRDPPSIAIIDPTMEMGFDPTHASPMGRIIGFDVTKKW